MAAITATIRRRPAIAIPMAKSLCGMQMVLGSYALADCNKKLLIYMYMLACAYIYNDIFKSPIKRYMYIYITSLQFQQVCHCCLGMPRPNHLLH